MNEQLTFGKALEYAMHGARISRTAWMGASWVATSPGVRDNPADKFWSEQNRIYALEFGGKATVLPYLTMKLPTGAIVPWTPTQEDLFAADWCVTRGATITSYDLGGKDKSVRMTAHHDGRGRLIIDSIEEID